VNNEEESPIREENQKSHKGFLVEQDGEGNGDDRQFKRITRDCQWS